jgi:hypothetical protein
VPAQDHQVFAARPAVLLAARADLEEIADQAVLQDLLQVDHPGRQADLVGDGGADLMFLHGSHHGVRLRQRHRYRLFHVDVGPHPGRRLGHLQPVLRVVGADRDEIGPLPFEHLSIVHVGTGSPGPAGGPGATLLVRVRDADDGHGGDLLEGHVQPVPVPAPPRRAYHAGPVRLRGGTHRFLRRGRPAQPKARNGRRGRREEIPP